MIYVNPAYMKPADAGTGLHGRLGQMGSQFSFGRLVFGIIAVALMLYGFRYAMTQAIQTVIASQPAPTKFQSLPMQFDFSGCDLGFALSTSRPANPCRLDVRPPPAPPPPVPQMSKRQSATASFWFLLAALLPLGLGGAALVGYCVLKGE